jgi:hypothetical protein
MKVAIRLFQEDGLTILMAARFANDRKLHETYVLVSLWICYTVKIQIDQKLSNKDSPMRKASRRQ